MSNPLVSVVMPTYNHANFIKEAIDSVLGQSYSNIEVIIVDNYSEDNTSEIIQSIADERIKYVQFRNNGIIAASRNHGISQVRGKYVAFIDSDDIWLENKLKEQVEKLESNERNGISFCQFKVISSNKQDDGKILGPKKAELPGNLYERLMKANFIVSSSTVVLKKALDEVGVFDEKPDLRCSEDFDLWLRIIRKYRAAYVHDIGGIYRMHDSNASSNDLVLKRALAVIDKHHKEGWITTLRADQARASFYFQVGWTIVDTDPKLARSYFKKAYQLDSINPKMWSICSLGISMTMIPAVYRLIRRNKIDKKIGRRTINPQNL